MTFTSFTGLLNTVSSLGLAVFVFLKRPRHNTNQAYLFFGLTVALYSVGYFLWGLAPSESGALFAFKILTAGIILINSAYLEFVFSLLGGERKKRIILWICHAVNLFFVYAVFSLLLFETVARKNIWGYWPVVENLFYVYFVLWLGQFLYGLIHLYRGYKSTTGLRSTQIKYVFTSTLIGYFGGATNWLPWFDITFFPPHLNILVTAYVAILAYAVLRYRLMDIEVIIRRTLVFAGIVLVSVSAISLPIGLIQLVVGRTIGVPPLWLMVLGIVTSVLIYRPLERRLVDLTDKFLFQKKYDYRKLLKDAAAGISQIKSLNQLLSLVVHFITMRIRTRNASVLIHDEKNNYFKFGYARGYPVKSWLKPGHIFNAEDPLIEYLDHERQPLDLERVKEWAERLANPKSEIRNPKLKKARRYDFKTIKARMDELLAHCCVPSFLGNRLLGILILGEKKSGDVYSEEDLAVLFTIAQESAIAIENARLYDEAIEKAKELELINQELNNAQTKLLRALNETEAANKKLKETQASLISAQKKAALVGMAQAIGHEVYNPLVPISGKAQHIYMIHVKKFDDLLNKYRHEMVEDDIKTFEKAIKGTDDYAHSIVNNVDRVQKVVQTLTGTLKASTGQMDILNLAVYCERMLQTLRFTTGEENISGSEIELDIAENLFIRGNSDQLDEVLLNLIKNAYEAMAQREDRRIVIQGRLDSQNPEVVRIDVTDNGPGIPPEILPKIWQQGFSTKKRKDDSIGAAGQGHGLFVCKHLIEGFHRGMITVTSTVGKGTTFIITLPLVKQKE